MTELSPAAQAVVAAIEKFDWESGHFSREEIWHCSREVVAAALRAAADQFFFDWNGMCCEEHLKAIAAELEGAQ